ncbi:hypothetical protein Nocox_35635 [Nonomuraea coxensis DSM 45129]|uniref:Uncharacterized protein n=1 Tax=Nonomuraea coxensis DSM 45129 TaxID=1122611 RepID=A0ABX8UCM8_9ACTN|nr:hypothetical protein [Nonomuraea coxensis]QYC44686.1 hypothetical protein Nocox_35635 [Nonomuraea coxensis DSM 45129]
MTSTPDAGCIATDCTTGSLADALTKRIATQAANYSRAIRAGCAHDPTEVASLLAEVRALHDELTGGQTTGTTP